ncbi:BTB/POZ domain-containing protein [Ditylenchus destructor]|uniref:BTB/POZ domain-containing protein n=1 Tax=Ditylenchus destructor TaxID=166010 RepID=A0AAD4MEF0_9BILA|nr:BTB/POZ domain-containing protein [Ditylenchus destructor]
MSQIIMTANHHPESSESIYGVTNILLAKHGNVELCIPCALWHKTKDIIRKNLNSNFGGKQNKNGWGLLDLATCDKLLDPEEGYIKDDTIVLQVDVDAEIPLGIHFDEAFLCIYRISPPCNEARAISDLKQLKKEIEYAASDCRTKAILLDEIVESSPNPPCVASSTIKEETSDQEVISNARALEILDKLESSSLAQSDGVLIVESNRITIHKMYLAMFSKYFNILFLGEFKESNQDEIVLEAVGYTDILELLIEYAQQYKSVDDVKQLKAELEYELLDEKTRSLIFDSITS